MSNFKQQVEKKAEELSEKTALMAKSISTHVAEAHPVMEMWATISGALTYAGTCLSICQEQDPMLEKYVDAVAKIVHDVLIMAASTVLLTEKEEKENTDGQNNS